MISFLSVIPWIEYALIFGLFAFLLLAYLSTANTVYRSENADTRPAKIKVIPMLIGLAVLTALLVIGTTMINA